MADNLSGILLAVLLVEPVDLRQVVVARLHGPDIVTILTEGLGGVFADGWINEERFTIGIHHEGAHVIVVVAFTVGAAFHGHIEISPAGSHDLEVRQPYIF